MEIWQSLVIKRNLPRLIDLTLCNTKLLTLLYAKEVLSDEDVLEIEVTQNPKRKARKFYEIVVTRIDAYNLLLDACKETRQTGVASILQEEILKHETAKANESFAQSLNQELYLPEVADNAIQKLSSKTSTISSVLPVSYLPGEASNKINFNGGSECFEQLSNNQLIDLTIQPLRNLKIEPAHSIGTDKSNKTFGSFVVKNVEKQPVLTTDPSEKHNSPLSKFNSNTSELKINQVDNKGRTKLHRSLGNGSNLDAIKALVDQKADYQMKDTTKLGALHFAVEGGNKEVIRFLLSLKLDINEVDEDGETPLHLVRFTKNRDFFEMTAFLLDIGADVCAKDKHGDNIAHLFVMTRNISSDDFRIWATCMIENGHSNIFAARGKYGRTPLQSAIGRYDLDLETIKLILKSSKVDIDQQDDDGYTLLQLALHSGRSIKTIKILIQLGANIKTKDQNMNGVLHLAVSTGNVEVIKYFISQGLDVNENNSYGFTPLLCVKQTRQKNHFELTKVLLENGADLYSKNNNGYTLALGMALEKDLSSDEFNVWITAMIENGHVSLFNIRGGKLGRTPLHVAMQKRDVELETIRLMVKSAKLVINQPDDKGDTILHTALCCGRSFDTIKNLVELGADWKRNGINDRSVLHSAVKGSNKEAFLFFKSLGADVNATDKYGETPLHRVRLTRSKEFLGWTEFLLENGADFNVKDKEGYSFKQMMSSCEEVSDEEYRKWKKGMMELGHESFFFKKKIK